MGKTVTFDFDGTLSRSDVQEYFKELIERGIDCWIVTSRYDDLHKHLYPFNPTNEDLWRIIDELNFPRHKVVFCNMAEKLNYLTGTNVLWHLDDDYISVKEISDYSDVLGIDVNLPWWKETCENLLIKN